MRRTFLIWLFVFICAAFTVTAGVVYWQFQRQARQQAEQLMITRLNDMLELVEYSVGSIQRLMSINDESSLSRTRAMAEIIRLNPDVLNNQEQLQGLCNDLGAEQAAITDDKGIIVSAVPASYRGFDLASGRNVQEFMKCINTPGHEYVQRPEEGGKGSELQYVGVHRQDQPGLIRLAFRPYHEQRARERMAYGRLAANHRLGQTGRIIAFRGGAPLNREALPGPAADFLSLPLGERQSRYYNGEETFVYAMEKGGFRLVGILPVSELYPMKLQSLRSQLFTNSLVFLAVFALVSFLLQRIVISGITRVNETLRRIAEGDVAARVNVATTPEFVRLSTGINTMLDSLKIMDDREDERRQKELELARYIQRATLPQDTDIPEQREFNLRATLLPAASVGGNFYDYFMTDENHLTFMVAAVSGSGVPAALFMMRSLSTIRSFARTGQSPAEVLAGANRVLCEGRTAEMHVCLFYGSLEISTGTLTCVNAGLSAPLLQQLGNSSYSELEIERSPVVGAVEGISYHSQQVKLAPGDRLFLYTEGILRAQNPQKQPFGLHRLQHALKGIATTLDELPNLVRKALRRFTEDTDQENDMTMLALEYRSIMRHGGQVSTLAGETKPVLELLSECLEAVLAAPVDIAALQKAASAALAFLPADTPVSVTLGCDESRAELSFLYPETHRHHLDGSDFPGIDHVHAESRPDGHHLTLAKTLG